MNHILNPFIHILFFGLSTLFSFFGSFEFCSLLSPIKCFHVKTKVYIVQTFVHV
jgi:hypothetical protein